jgi:diguanylate cyclase (GGDEF)-like protein/putative nucleotidyltransferase with HDIG domain
MHVNTTGTAATKSLANRGNGATTAAERRGIGHFCAWYALIYGFLSLLTVAHRLDRQALAAYQLVAPFAAATWGLSLVGRLGLDRRRRQRSSCWFRISLGCLLWGLAQALALYYIVCLGFPAPSPGILDIFFLSAHGLLLAGVIPLVFARLRAERLRLVIEGVITAISITSAGWYFVIETLWRASEAPLVTKIVNVACPALDVVTLLCLLILLGTPRLGKVMRLTVSYITVGMILTTVADTGCIQYSFQGLQSYGVLNGALWTLGWFMIGYAMLVQRRGWLEAAAPSAAQRLAYRRPTLALLFLPYVAAGIVCMAFMVKDYFGSGGPRIATFVATYVLLSLVVMRQMFTQRDNQRLNHDLAKRLQENRLLTEKLRAFNDGLEQVVERRSQQLGALHHLTKAVHTSQEIEEVLAAAVNHTGSALNGVTAAIWLHDNSLLSHGPQLCLSCVEVMVSDQNIEQFTRGYSPTDCDDWRLMRVVSTEHGEPITHGEMLCCPLRFRNESVGVIAVTRRLPDYMHPDEMSLFDQSDRDLLDSIAIEVATALHHARQFAQARDDADRDPVTNLYNHRAIHQHLDEELARAKAEHRPMAVMMMDLDDFKIFNDTYGHPVGDQALRHVAKALRQENPLAICGRYGGDEFLVVVPHSTASQARDFAERLRQRLISGGFQSPASDSNETVPIAISFGVALYPEDSTNRQDLLNLADANLYKAKRSDSGIGVTTNFQRVRRQLSTESSFGILDAMVTSVDNKDKYTRQHSEDVARYALWLAQELRLSDETMRLIRIGGLLHDVGKIGIPEEILRKPGRLTMEEYDVIRQHPHLGALIVSAIPGMEGIVDAVRHHHERWDGKGYPDKLGGTDIPMIGRVMAVADAYSAMTTNRPYRAGMHWRTALAEIQKNVGTQFDPLMARAFCNVVTWRMELDGGETGTTQDDPEGDPDLRLAA